MYKGLSWTDALETWKRTNRHGVAALQAIGKAIGGLRTDPSMRIQKFHVQRSIHWDPIFHALLGHVHREARTYSPKLRSQALGALASCFEDLSVYRDAYEHTDFIVEMCAE